MHRIIFTVTSDLSYDQRMIRICESLSEEGFDVLLVGRQKPDSVPLQNYGFGQKRLNTWFWRGKLFYMEYNIRLFFYLLFCRCSVICGIDLDTALAAWSVAHLKGKPFVYDAHEFFTEIPELVDRPAIKRIWLQIEKFILNRTKHAYTVSQSIADIYKERYGVSFEVVRNIAVLQNIDKDIPKENAIIYVGAVNMGRGLEELVLAMHKINAALWICGEGDVKNQIEDLVRKEGLESKIKFKGNVPVRDLFELTQRARVGYLMLSFQGLSYYYSLANKFFDYMHAGLPQVTINFPEYALVNQEYEVALLTELNVESIADSVNSLLEDKALYERLHNNALTAREAYNWGRESEKLVSFYRKVLQK